MSTSSKISNQPQFSLKISNNTHSSFLNKAAGAQSPYEIPGPSNYRHIPTRNRESIQNPKSFILLKQKDYTPQVASQLQNKSYFNHQISKNDIILNSKTKPDIIQPERQLNTLESQDADDTTTLQVLRTPKMQLAHRKVQSGVLNSQSRNLQALRPVLTTYEPKQQSRPQTGSFITYKQDYNDQPNLYVGAKSSPIHDSSKRRTHSGQLLGVKRSGMLIVTNHFKERSLTRQFTNIQLEAMKDSGINNANANLKIETHKISLCEKRSSHQKNQSSQSENIIIDINKETQIVTESLKEQPQVQSKLEKVSRPFKITRQSIKFQNNPPSQVSKSLNLDPFLYIMEKLKQPSRQPIIKTTQNTQKMEGLSKKQFKRNKSSLVFTDPLKEIQMPVAYSPFKSRNQHSALKSLQIQKAPSMKLLSQMLAPLKSSDELDLRISSPFPRGPSYNDEFFEAERRAELRLNRHQSAAVMRTLKSMPGFRPYKILVDKKIGTTPPNNEKVDLNLENRIRQKGSNGPNGAALTSRERYQQFKRASHIKDAENFLRSRVLHFNSPHSRPQTSNNQLGLLRYQAGAGGNTYYHNMEIDLDNMTPEEQPPLQIQVYCSVTRKQNQS